MTKTPANAGNTGSPTTGEPVYLAVGLLRRPHGVHGDMLMEIYTDFPERLNVGTNLYAGDEHIVLTIARKRPHNDGLLLGFKGIDTPEAVGRYRNMVLYVPTADRPSLPDGEYYYHQLLGLNVVSDDGKQLGVLDSIIETGANDVFVVKSPNGNEILLPVIPDVLQEIELEKKTIHVHLLPGLLGDTEEA
jgi:16S rRNA processing protein RimM